MFWKNINIFCMLKSKVAMTEILERQISQEKKYHIKETFLYAQGESELIPIWLTSNLSLDHTAVRMSFFNFTVL